METSYFSVPHVNCIIDKTNVYIQYMTRLYVMKENTPSLNKAEKVDVPIHNADTWL